MDSHDIVTKLFKIPVDKPGRCGRVVSASACQAGGLWFKSSSAETRMWGKRPAAMLAICTGRGVAPEVNLRERISHMPPQSSNKAEPTLALKPRGDVTRSLKQGYQWPQKWTCPTKIRFLSMILVQKICLL